MRQNYPLGNSTFTEPFDGIFNSIKFHQNFLMFKKLSIEVVNKIRSSLCTHMHIGWWKILILLTIFRVLFHSNLVIATTILESKICFVKQLNSIFVNNVLKNKNIRIYSFNLLIKYFSNNYYVQTTVLSSEDNSEQRYQLLCSLNYNFGAK
jgi:hypothetical protein